MNVKETYDYLESVQKLNQLLYNKQAELEQLETLATKTTQDNDGMPHASGTSDKVGNIVPKIAEKKDEITDIAYIIATVINEIAGHIQQLDSKHYDTLHKLYIQRKCVKEVAEINRVSRQAVYALREKAVTQLGNIIPVTTVGYASVLGLYKKYGKPKW